MMRKSGVVSDEMMRKSGTQTTPKSSTFGNKRREKTRPFSPEAENPDVSGAVSPQDTRAPRVQILQKLIRRGCRKPGAAAPPEATFPTFPELGVKCQQNFWKIACFFGRRRFTSPRAPARLPNGAAPCIPVFGPPNAVRAVPNGGALVTEHTPGAGAAKTIGIPRAGTHNYYSLRPFSKVGTTTLCRINSCAQ